VKLRNVTNRFPRSVTAVEGNIKIEDIKFNKNLNELQLQLKAHDIQGETGLIHVQY
jgi:hypothetical protein